MDALPFALIHCGEAVALVYGFPQTQPALAWAYACSFKMLYPSCPKRS